MGRKVLVVDDEPLVLDVVATMLEELGCHVEKANTGADALNRLGSEEHIDILEVLGVSLLGQRQGNNHPI